MSVSSSKAAAKPAIKPSLEKARAALASSLTNRLPSSSRPLPRAIPARAEPVEGLPEVLHPGAPILSEVFSATGACAVPAGFVLAQLPRGAFSGRPILWIQDRLSLREAGRPYLGGSPEGLRILRVAVSRPVDALWAMEEGLGCDGLAAVVGEVWGDPQAVDFTATKRLAMRAETQGRPAWLIRRAASPDLSAARRRWRLGPLPSLPCEDDLQAPGQPRWAAELFRTRTGQPGRWQLVPEMGGLRAEPLEGGTEEALPRESSGSVVTVPFGEAPPQRAAARAG
ncbi:ImuA family protein [Aestuariibius sp. 2305UL40-4]|uniref:ImuA family protein n=1 Tax=Aestuariibius violaceus TaxID=3234132 RepID=UPI00345EB3AB